MTSVPKNPAPQAKKPASQTDTIIRVVLFLVLGYMLFALAYDYLYVFKTHDAKFQELTKMVEKETSRSADDRKEKGPIGPKDVQEAMGFAPGVAEEKEHYTHERYTYHRALPFMTRDIDVFYKQYQGDSEPGIYSVAHTKEDLETATPTGPVPPNTDAASETPAEVGSTSSETTKKTVTPETDTEDKKKTEPAEDTTPETPTEEKKSETPAPETKADETKTEETKE